MKSPEYVQLSHGGGGLEMNQFISHLFFDKFNNPILSCNEDAATLMLAMPMAMTTDSFTVSPLFFQGGNIGSLAVAGTCNDLAMVGAKPKYLTCSFIIEEGMAVTELEVIVDTMVNELTKIGVQIVCGDTKVVPKGSADKVFINTTGVGEVLQHGISSRALQQDDVVLVSRDIGCHGACILADREALRLEHAIHSDCELLWPTVEGLLSKGIEIHAMRDATRGGLSAVLNEWCQASQVQIQLNESEIPVSEAVQGVCELFGFEACDLANEGTFVLAVPPHCAESALRVLQCFQPEASVIGKVVASTPNKPILTNPWGSRRYLDFPVGELLPRIC
ncbi:hydrogenase expression/formation protein HypE [Vibrio mediterranei]